MSENLFDIRGKVALITGANAGIGFGYAEAIAQQGGDVVLERAAAAGFESIWSHAMPGIRFAYLEREGTVIELLENTGTEQ